MSKYMAKKIKDLEGNIFDSKAEYRRWVELKREESLGVITNLQRQVEYQLLPTQKLDTPRKNGERVQRNEPRVKYIADFVYERDGATIVEDVKGIKTDSYVLKRKLMKYIHGIEIKEVAMK